MLSIRERFTHTRKEVYLFKTFGCSFHWFIPLVFALMLLLPIDGIPVSPDGAYYIGIGLHLSHGQGLIDLARAPVYHRPLFPAMLGLLFMAGAPTYLGSFLLIRFFFLISLLLVSSLGRILFNKYVGFVAALLVLSSYRLNEWSTWVNLDLVLATFILGYIYCTYLGFIRKRRDLFFVAGLILGFGFLVKETAILFLTVPLLFTMVSAISKPHTAPDLKNSTWFSISATIRSKIPSLVYALITVSGFLLPVSAWAGYVQLISQDFRLMFGRSASDNLARLASQSSPSTNSLFSKNIFDLLPLPIWDSALNFYQWHLAANFIIAPLFCLAIVTLTIAAIRFNNAARYLLCTLVCYAPLIILFGTLGHRSAQSIAFYCLLYISLAYTLVLFMTAGVNKWEQVKKNYVAHPYYNLVARAWFVASCLPILIVLLWQFGWDVNGNLPEHLSRFNSIAALRTEQSQQKIRSPEPWWPTAHTIRGVEKLAVWITMENKEASLRILGIQNDNRYLNLATNGRHSFYQLRHTSMRVDKSHGRGASSKAIQFVVEPLNATFQKQATDQQKAEHSNFLVYTQDSLLQLVIEKKIDYVVVGHPQKWLANYFTNHPAFVKQNEFEYGTLQVYKVLQDRIHPIDIPLTIDPNIHPLLDVIDAHRPDRIPDLKEDFVHLDPEGDSLLFGEIALELPNNAHLYSFGYRGYGTWNLQTGNLASAVNVAKNKHRENPNNPWPIIALGALIEAQGRESSDQELLLAASGFYRKSLTLEPGNWRAPWALLELHSEYPELVDAESIEEAINALRVRTLLYPDDPRAFKELAVNYKRLGQMNKAEETYQQAIDASAVDGALYFSFGWFYETIGDIPAAIATYQVGLTIAPKPTAEYRNMEARLVELSSKN